MIMRSIVPPTRAAAFAAILCLAPQLAVAQTRAFEKAPGKLELRLKSSHPVMRSGAPFALELEFESTFPDLIEGPLELTFLDDNRVQTRFVTIPFAIQPDATTSYQVHLPSMSCLRTQMEFQVRVVLNSTRRTFNLGKFDVLVPIKGMRQFVIAAPGLKEVAVDELVRHLSLDEFRPHKLNRQNFATFSTELDAHRILGDPIALYPYDVLVLLGQHFASLSARQLETLATWIESGGGLVVVLTGALSETHRSFLAKLTGKDRTHFQTDALGRLPQLPVGHPDWLTACRYGFGRALILRSVPQFAPNPSEAVVARSPWIRAVAFLWNVRAEQVDSILSTGVWVMPSPPPLKLAPNQSRLFATPDLKYASYGDPGGLKTEEPAAANDLRDLLFPADVRVVPFAIVVALLASFLVIVAPADYWILGWLRRRRYTWIVFPCVSLVFTAVTVSIANYYSGNTDHRGSLVIVDVGQAGRALRTTRIVHVITADTHSLTADIRDGLFAKTDVQPAQLNRPPVKDPIDEAPVNVEEGIAYEGLLPSAFTVTWPSRQWSPAMHRLTRAASDIEIPSLDWAELDRVDLGTDAGRSAAIARLRNVLPQCSVMFSNAKVDVAFPFRATVEGPIDQFQDWPSVLASLARRRDHGLLAILFGVSPDGAGDLEDPAVLDEGDTTTWLVHVATVRDNDLIVFRHVVRKTQVREIEGPTSPGGKRRS
jgi:hypothetical protein